MTLVVTSIFSLTERCTWVLDTQKNTLMIEAANVSAYRVIGEASDPTAIDPVGGPYIGVGCIFNLDDIHRVKIQRIKSYKDSADHTLTVYVHVHVDLLHSSLQ